MKSEIQTYSPLQILLASFHYVALSFTAPLQEKMGIKEPQSLPKLILVALISPQGCCFSKEPQPVTVGLGIKFPLMNVNFIHSYHNTQLMTKQP